VKAADRTKVIEELAYVSESCLCELDEEDRYWYSVPELDDFLAAQYVNHPLTRHERDCAVIFLARAAGLRVLPARAALIRVRPARAGKALARAGGSL